MTPAERALLLAVAKHVHRHVEAGPQQRGNLFIAIAAVEAEAAHEAPTDCNGTGKKENTDDHT
jgi:hypothetical protein